MGAVQESQTTPNAKAGICAADARGDRLTPKGADIQPLDQLENVDSVFVITADSPALLACLHARASQISCLFPSAPKRFQRGSSRGTREWVPTIKFGMWSR